MSKPAPIVLTPVSSTSPPPSLPYVSLLPCQIAHTGPAPIATYFPVHPTSVPNQLEAAFRGRLLVSSPFAVPEGYTGLVFKTTSPAPAVTRRDASPDRDEKHASKRVKLSPKKRANGDETEERKPLWVPTGVRRSPRKKVEVKKFSFDSDSEDEEEADVKAEKVDTLPVEMNMKEEVAHEVVMLDGESIVTATVETVQVTSTTLSAQSTSSTLIGSEPIESEPSLIATSETTVAVIEPETEAETVVGDDVETQETLQEESADEPELARDVQYLVPTATFDTVRIWNADYALDVQEDTYGRTLTEWFGVASLIHAY